MNDLITEEYFDGLREEGLLLIDTEARKIGIVANTSGQVLFVAEEDGHRMALSVFPEEVDAICSALHVAARQATAIGNRIEAEYETFTAIQKALGK